MVFFRDVLLGSHYRCGVLSGNYSRSFQRQLIHYLGCMHITWIVAIDFSLRWPYISSVSSLTSFQEKNNY